MKLRVLLVATTALFAAACSKDGGVISDPRKWLSDQAEKDGPAVDGVNATLYKAAQDAENAGDFRTAATYYQQLVDKEPENKTYTTSLAEAVRKLGDADKAIAIYGLALAKDANHAPALEGKALAQMQRGEFDAAEQGFAELAKNGKATWRTYNALGIIYASRQQPIAKQYFDEAVRQSPANPSVLNNMGLWQAVNREFEPSLTTLAQASSAASAKPLLKRQVDLNAAMVYAAAGKLDNAEAIARQYFDGPALNNNMGFYAHLAKDDELAKTYLNMALTQSKRFYPRAMQNLEALDQPAQASLAPSAGSAAPLVPMASAAESPAPAQVKPVALTSTAATVVTPSAQTAGLRPSDLVPPPVATQDPIAVTGAAPNTAASMGFLVPPPGAQRVAVQTEVMPPAAQPAVSYVPVSAPLPAPTAATAPVQPSAALQPAPSAVQAVPVATVQPPVSNVAVSNVPVSTVPGYIPPGQFGNAQAATQPVQNAAAMDYGQLAPAAGGAPVTQAQPQDFVMQPGQQLQQLQPVAIQPVKKEPGTLESVGNWFGSVLD